jgi:bacteriophage protein of unknown function (DUF646)
MEVDADDFLNALDLVKKVYPKKVKKFMQKEGNRLRAKTVLTADERVDEKTGNYRKSIKRGKPYVYAGNGADSIRVYSTAPHAHLIEYGHVQDTSKGEISVPGRLVFDSARKEFESIYETDALKFVDEIAKELS